MVWICLIDSYIDVLSAQVIEFVLRTISLSFSLQQARYTVSKFFMVPWEKN